MIKVLTIGNSFSEDAQAWLQEICKAGGIEVMAACSYIAGCTFKRHCDRIESNAPDYELIIGGSRTGRFMTFEEVAKMEKWDIIAFNQGSTQAGRPFTYFPYLNTMIDLLLKYSPDAKLYMFETWAYELDANHAYYPVYNSNQREMWIRTRDCYKMAADLLKIPIIPVGDVIQHIRETIPEFDYKNGGMSLNRDGFHLSEIYGRYAAGLTFYYSLFSGNVMENDFLPYCNDNVADKGIIEKIKKAVIEVVDRPVEEDDL